MSGKALVIVKVSNEKYRSIYVHRCGDKKQLGSLLLNSYEDYSKVLDLVSLGNLERVGASLSSAGFGTIAYMRDQGHLGQHAREFDSLEDAIWKHPYGAQQNNYYFDSEAWHLVSKDSQKPIFTLREMLANEPVTEGNSICFILVLNSFSRANRNCEESTIQVKAQSKEILSEAIGCHMNRVRFIGEMSPIGVDWAKVEASLPEDKERLIDLILRKSLPTANGPDNRKNTPSLTLVGSE